MQLSASNSKSTSTQARRKRRHVNKAALLVSLIALVIIIPLICISLTIILFQVFELNLPGVTVYDKDVGLMSRDETVAWINSCWNEDRLIQLISSEDPEESYWLHPSELGLWVDSEATAEAAFKIGRGADPFTELITAVSGEKQIIYPVLYFNDQAAREQLETISDELTIQAEEAVIVYQNDAWVALPGSAGRTVDIDTTLNELFNNAFMILLSQTATVQVKAVPPELSDLTPILDDIEAVVAQELGFEGYDPITDERFTWSVSTEVKRTWVAVDPETFEISLSPEPDMISAVLDEWEADLGEGRSWETPPDPHEVMESWVEGETGSAIITHNPTTYYVDEGDSLWSISLNLGIPMWYIMDANEGLTTSNLEAGMTLVIPSKNDLLPLPVIPDKRIVIDISEQHMIVYEDGQVWASYIISTGMSDSPTMVGVFQIQTHELNAYASNWDLYMPHFLGIYEAWPGFMNGIHGLPLLSSGGRLWASALGSPASYGCIILDLNAAEALYFWAEDGVVVEIID